MIYNNAIRSISEQKKSVIFKKTHLSYHQFQIFEKIETESQIDYSIELSERINLFIKQNTYFLSNSPNDSILSCICHICNYIANYNK